MSNNKGDGKQRLTFYESYMKTKQDKGSGLKCLIRQTEGEQDCQFPHIVRANEKIYCNNCGNWNWLMHWVRFITEHQHCMTT